MDITRIRSMSRSLLMLMFAASGTLAGALAVAADRPMPAFPRMGFACCTLHYEKDWISDGNYAILPSIPPGTPIKVLGYARHHAYAEINGRKMRLGHDYGREQESLDQWVHKIVVDTDPTAKIAGYPPEVQAAIH